MDAYSMLTDRAALYAGASTIGSEKVAHGAKIKGPK